MTFCRGGRGRARALLPGLPLRCSALGGIYRCANTPRSCRGFYVCVCACACEGGWVWASWLDFVVSFRRGGGGWEDPRQLRILNSRIDVSWPGLYCPARSSAMTRGFMATGYILLACARLRIVYLQGGELILDGSVALVICARSAFARKSGFPLHWFLVNLVSDLYTYLPAVRCQVSRYCIILRCNSFLMD